MAFKVSRRGVLIGAVATMTAAAAAGGGVLFMLWKDRSYFRSPLYARKADGRARVLVVYYSRSGNTEAMAREIARHYQADIARISAEAYSLDFTGWNAARRDAAAETETEIAVPNLDFAAYDLVFIGSPIWLYRPAPPLWRFVRQSAFRGRDLVLFNTFNSRFKQPYIDEFAELIAVAGGRLVDHVYVRRGRIYAQMSGPELIAKVRQLITDRVARWKV